MNEVGFRNWATRTCKNQKVTGDNISRLKKVERELGQIDLDEEYKKDRCSYLLSLFDNTGRNPEMEKYCSSLPLGKYYLSSYKYAIKLYIEYLDDYHKVRSN